METNFTGPFKQYWTIKLNGEQIDLDGRKRYYADVLVDNARVYTAWNYEPWEPKDCESLMADAAVFLTNKERNEYE